MIIQILAVCLLAAVIYFGVLPWIRCRRLRSTLQSPTRTVFFPLGGYIAASVVRHGKSKDLLAWLPEGKQPNEQFMVSNLFASPYVILQTPQLAQEYLLNHTKFFKQNIALFSELYFSKSIAITTGDEWNRQKKIMSKAMNFEFLRNIVPVIQQSCQRVFQETVTGQPMSVYKPTFEIAAEVVSYAFFSRNMNEVKVRGMGLITKLRQNLRYCVNRTPTLQFLVRVLILGKDSTKWGRFLTSEQSRVLEDFKTVAGIIQTELASRIERLRNKEPTTEDFLDYYASLVLSEENSENKQVTIDQVVQQFITLFTAGADTTSTLAGMCLYFLATHPEHAKQIQQLSDGLPAKLTLEDINKDEFLTHFIKEVARMYTPVFDLFIRYNKEPVTLGGHLFPPNTYFGLGIKTIMNDPNNFPEPNSFKPERWQSTAINPFSFLAFSAGPRSCIGERLAMLEIKVMLLEFARQFTVATNPAAEFKMKIEQVYRMADEFMVVPETRPTQRQSTVE